MRLSKQDSDFDATFSQGPIKIPAGAVFNYSGPAFGPASNPQDYAHSAASGWKGLTEAEAKRRGDLLMAYVDRNKRQTEGLVTLVERTLTKSRPCALIPVAAAHSTEWNWTISPIYGSSERYYQLYGIIRGTELDTHFDNDKSPLDYAGSRGALNGILTGTTDRSVEVPN